MKRAGLVALVSSCLAASPAGGQVPVVRGYYLHVASGGFENALVPGGVGDFQRLRMMTAHGLGSVAFDVAYEHALLYASAGAASNANGGVGVLPGGTEWLPLQGTIAEGEHVLWRHRLDRLAVTLTPTEAFEITVGRQTISWATTLMLTPGDPFVPFDPAEPFREYRAGVDALRARGFFGGFTEFEVVVRPSDTPVGKTVTALGRGRTLVQGVEIAGWVGTVHEEATAGLGTTVTAAGAAMRAEGTLRRSDAGTVVRLAIGVDRRFPVAGRDLYLVLEYQRDGFGAAGAEQLGEVLLSEPFARRELQVLGRDVVAFRASMQVHPLASVGLLTLLNANDTSVLGAPAVTYSAGEEVTLSGGVFIGFGSGATPAGLPASEYGSVPTTMYLSATVFF